MLAATARWPVLDAALYSLRRLGGSPSSSPSISRAKSRATSAFPMQLAASAREPPGPSPHDRSGGGWNPGLAFALPEMGLMFRAFVRARLGCKRLPEKALALLKRIGNAVFSRIVSPALWFMPLRFILGHCAAPPKNPRAPCIRDWPLKLIVVACGQTFATARVALAARYLALNTRKDSVSAEPPEWMAQCLGVSADT